MPSRSSQDRSAANRYLARRAEKTRLTTAPAPNLGLVVAIPAFDEPDLTRTLKSLMDANSPSCAVEVIVLVNHPENASTALTERSKRLVGETHQWLQAQNCDSLNVHILGPVPLTAKHAGVGLARKTAMDEALRRLTDVNAPNGIIACLDADCVVTTNYLQAIENKANTSQSVGAWTVAFEHPLDDPQLGIHITHYELFLRYYRLGLLFAGSAHAVHTVGSSMVVRAHAYGRQGGMNRRQAGEDFYFMQKLIDGEQVENIAEATVFPAARLSHRVPFGTGKALNDAMERTMGVGFYSPRTFADLKGFFDQLPICFESGPKPFLDRLSEPLQEFLNVQDADSRLQEVGTNVATLAAFERRAKRWLNGFRAMKYARHAAEQHYPYEDPIAAVATLNAWMGQLEPKDQSLKGWLTHFRQLERTI